MLINQNDLERIKDLLGRGLINAEEANIQVIEHGRYTIIDRSIPADLRKAYREGVKQGRLVHFKKNKEKRLFEGYCKKGFEYLLRTALLERRDADDRARIKALSAVMVHHKDLK